MGEKINDYEMVKILKQGRFGYIYLANDKIGLKEYVIKKVSKSDNTSAINALQRESKFSFNENGLPQVIDFLEDESFFYLITAFIEGITLEEYWKSIDRKKYLSTIQNIIGKLEPIMLKLSEENVIHCDIKPSNIIVNQTEDKFDLSLVDFGLAIDKNEVENRALQFPLGYAAPELLLNELDLVTAKTDVFSLGIMIWRMIVGKLPLHHPNPSIYTNLQLTHPVPQDSRLNTELYEIIAKATVKPKFKLPPNRLQREEVRLLLQESISQRIDINELSSGIQDLSTTKKRWFFFSKGLF